MQNHTVDKLQIQNEICCKKKQSHERGGLSTPYKGNGTEPATTTLLPL